jgi:hypothetical protein
MWPMLDLITDIAEVVCCLRVGLPNAAPSSSVFWSRWRLLSRHCPALCGANEAAVPDPDHWRRFSALEADLLSRFCSVSAWLTVTRMSVASEGLGMPLAYHFSQPPVRRGGLVQLVPSFLPISQPPVRRGGNSGLILRCKAFLSAACPAGGDHL